MAKPPPTAPRAFIGDRPISAGHDSAMPPTGLPRGLIHDHPPIPAGPRAQQQRPSSKQWINPNLKKVPDSPKMIRTQTLAQPSPAPFRRDSAQAEQQHGDQRRPRSSDAKSDPRASAFEDRARSQHSAELGEITGRPESDSRAQWGHRDRHAGAERFPNGQSLGAENSNGQPARDTKRKRRQAVPVLQFALPPRNLVREQDSESDDDDMADYFDMEIKKTKAELSKLTKPSVPRAVVARFAVMSHGSMARILSEGEGLAEMLGPVAEKYSHPVGSDKPSEQLPGKQKASETQQEASIADEATDAAVADAPVDEHKAAAASESATKTEEMDIDAPSVDMPPALDGPSADVSPDDDRAQRASPGPKVPMEDDASAKKGARQSAPLEAAEEGSKPPSTPSQVADEDDGTESEDEAYMDIKTVRQSMATPPVDSLPDYSCKHWSKDKEFLASLESDPAIADFVAAHLRKIHLQEADEQSRGRKAYAENYVQYLDFTSDDPAAVKSRDKFSVSAPSADGSGATTPESKPEGRGSGRRFATERDLERILQVSMREDEERKERELRAQKEKYRSDKEAVIPDMYWDDEQRAKAQFVDRSGFTAQDRLVSEWRVLPPVNNFTGEEAELFERRYLELPKQWGKVAEVIPNRDFGTCIQYYYLMKKELNLKEKLKKQPKRRKKGRRDKQRSSALVSELGNGEQEGEENQETGENGERRRPRRAAAPTWGFEQPTTNSENAAPAGTPGRRGASAAAKGDQAEKTEKTDGRKSRRKTAKDKDGGVKGTKANQALAAAPAPPTGRGRSRSSSRAPNSDYQTPALPDSNRMPAPFEQQPAAPSGMHAPFPVQQQSMPNTERPKPLAASSISEVMAAPSLRPEPPPPPQPSLTTFNLQPQAERKTASQASSYWSVSEANDFPHLLRAFGSDWTSIAAHMGSKTAVMVKNYFVRQKDQGKSEWETIVQEADAKRLRGEKRPDPPQPTAGGRGRRYDNAAAPGADGQTEPSQAKMEVPSQPARPQPFSAYGVPIAQAPAPVQQPLAQPVQHSMAMQQHTVPQPAPQVMSPSAWPLRAPLQPFGFSDREREPPPQPQHQRVPLPQKAGGGAVPELREQRPLAAAQPLQPAHPDAMMERQKMEMQQQRESLQQREMQQREMQQRERERERERGLARQSERQAMRMNQEAELATQRHYEPFGHRQQPSHGGGPREPLSLARPASQEPSRSAAPPVAPPVAAPLAAQPYPPPVQQQQAPHPVRNLMSDPAVAQSPPLGPPMARPISSLQQRQFSGPAQEPYGGAPAAPMQAPPAPAAPQTRPKTSNIMSLLNDDPPPAAKRISDVSSTMSGASATPPPQGMGRTPSGPAPPAQLCREPDAQYSPYGRTPSGSASAMPPLKPTYSGSPNPPHHMASAPAERDYFRQHAYQPGHHGSGTNSPQASHHYVTPGQATQPQYQSQGGYHATYAAGSQAPHGASPPPQYAVHGSAPRIREVPPGGRENAWPHQGHRQAPSNMQQASGWLGQPPKTQAPPPQQSWALPHPSTTPKPSMPSQGWSSAPPSQQPHHMSMRDERSVSVYSSGSQPPHHRYAAPAPRPPEPIPPPAQPYPRYASTPGPIAPRDPREPGRSYTPGVYDGRGPPPPGPSYHGPDPRELQLRDARDPRDPRDMMARGLRPHEYDRLPDRYG